MSRKGSLLFWICVWIHSKSMDAKVNPFLNKPLFVHPSYEININQSIESSTGILKQNLEKMKGISTAYWIDTMDKLNGDDMNSVEGILKLASEQSPVPVVTFIVYDLPNRDCHALASNGEICCEYKEDKTCNYLSTGNCDQGLDQYQTLYIDPLVEILEKYHSRVPVVLVIEPDSLPNLVTNKADPRCGNEATIQAYQDGISYAIHAFSTRTPNITLYVDASHGGWLGWKQNVESFVELILSLDIVSNIRGFSTNVANYQPVGIPCPSIDWCLNHLHPNDPCCDDPCELLAQYNAANNELNFVQLLSNQSIEKIPDFHPYFIIDTGRNGVVDMRKDCSNWCNIRGAGVGMFPTSNTDHSLVDAFLWLKTPGESDGCTQYLPGDDPQICPRYDAKCGSVDSIGSREDEPRCPEAGHWFEYQIKQLVENAIWK